MGVYRFLLFLVTVGVLITAPLWNVVKGVKTRTYKVKISTKDDIGCRLSKKFLSFSLNAELMRKKWYGVDFGSQTLKTLLSGLQPAYLRLGGNAVNALVFNPQVQGIEQGTLNQQLIEQTYPTQPVVNPTDETTTQGFTTPATVQNFNVSQMQQPPTTVPTMPSAAMNLVTPMPSGQQAITTTPSPYDAAKPAITESTTAAYPTQQQKQSQQQQIQQQQQQQAQQQQQEQPGPTQSTRAQQTTQQQTSTVESQQQSNQPDSQSQNDGNSFNQAQKGQSQLPDTPPTDGVPGASTPRPYRKRKTKKKGKKSRKRNRNSKKNKNKKDRKARALLEAPFSHSFFATDEMDGSSSEGSAYTALTRQSDQSAYQYSAAMFDKLVIFCQETGLQLIFGLNAFARDQNNSLNTNNANELLQHAVAKGFKVQWELGNEPDRYNEQDPSRALSAAAVGQDFAKLRAILDGATKGKAFLYGPDVGPPPQSLKFLKDFLREGHAAVNAITWHHYYLEDKSSELGDFLNADTLENFRKAAESIHKVVKTTKTPLWIGESGDCLYGGVEGISNSYAAGFMFLDKLGLAARYCNVVLIKNGLIGGNDAMFGKDYVPTPNYWLAYLYKQLVGKRVLNLGGTDKLVRLYAHCAERSRLSLPKGSVVIYGLNLQPKASALLSLLDFKGKQVEEYILTAPNANLKSQSVNLNGQLMKMSDSGALPQIIGQKRKGKALLPALSYGFFVIRNAGHPLC